MNSPALTLAVQGLPHEPCGIETNHVELTSSVRMTAKFHTENAICWQKTQVLYACSNDIALKGGIKNHARVTRTGWENPSPLISNPSPFVPTLRFAPLRHSWCRIGDSWWRIFPSHTRDPTMIFTIQKLAFCPYTITLILKGRMANYQDVLIETWWQTLWIMAHEWYKQKQKFAIKQNIY